MQGSSPEGAGGHFAAERIQFAAKHGSISFNRRGLVNRRLTYFLRVGIARMVYNPWSAAEIFA